MPTNSQSEDKSLGPGAAALAESKALLKRLKKSRKKWKKNSKKLSLSDWMDLHASP
jgi:hypothetical protein